MKKKVYIWTDGACSPNPGTGGWGVIIARVDGKTLEKFNGGEKNTTNNRMEILSAIKALERIHEPSKIIIHSDSRYLIDGITKWIIGWMNSGWKTKSKPKGPVKNDDLWKQLYKLSKPHDIEWKWVRGHDGNAFNEKVDQLAVAGRLRLQKS